MAIMLDDRSLLLRAALLEREPAVAAWTEWTFRRMQDRRALDKTSVRLLPLLYRNLQTHGVEERLLAPLRAAYLANRSRNERLLGVLARELRALHAAGIETLVLKGAALATLYYRDTGARAMADVDVLVPRARAREAMALLQRRGWLHDMLSDPADHLAYRHAADFRHPRGWHLDLHWHALIECRDTDADAKFWSAARELDIGGVATRALSPADQLLHVCVHGKNWRYKASAIGWIADALAILKSSGSELDWERLVCQAEARRLGYLVQRAIEYLVEEFRAPVPSPALARLRSGRTSALERLEYRVMRTERRRVVLGKLPLLWFRWRRQSRNGARVRGPGSFVDFLRHHWSLDRASQVPYHFVAKAVRRAVQVPTERLQRR